jgi:hypothetical protein
MDIAKFNTTVSLSNTTQFSHAKVFRPFSHAKVFQPFSHAKVCKPLSTTHSALSAPRCHSTS